MNREEIIDLVSHSFNKMQEKENEISANIGIFDFKRNPKYDTALSYIRKNLK